MVLKTKSLRAFRAYELKLKKNEVVNSEDHLIEISWDLNNDEIKRLLQLRYRKYREMALGGFTGQPSAFSFFCQRMKEKSSKVYYTFRYDVLRSQHKQVKQVIKDVSGEGSVLLKQVSAPIAAAYDFIASKQDGKQARPSVSNQQAMATEFGDTYTSPLANEDRTISCPNAEKYGCKDLWVPDLYGEFCRRLRNLRPPFPPGI